MNRIPKCATAVVVALTLIAWIASPAIAGAQVRGEGAAKLLQSKPQPTVAATAPMKTAGLQGACPKCKDTWVTVKERPTKTGALPETKAIQRHECPGCSVNLQTVGTGKQAKNMLKHVCDGCGNGQGVCGVTK